MKQEHQLTKLIREARFIWVCGNGGSAATAEHFVTDLVKKGYPAISLNSNSSLMTMIGNDYGYEYVFSKQLDAYAHPGDLVITISCSGTSPNVVNAFHSAESKGVRVYQFETFGDGPRDFAALEDKHLKFVHEIAGEL